ncbi:hypothetical protein [Qipengyuania zhejiangensis]|uniref:hypothetical protein n=1 Tax=Qipengyuania zhejiangensis TaxID=3077782 RepID=UPI002D780906|nr:hypothetical protein [Qipengyuania sp. Z2]
MRGWLAPIAAATLCLGAPLQAQDDSSARILHSVDEFLRGLNEKDLSVMEGVSAGDGIIASHRVADGKDVLRTRSFTEGLASLTSGTERFREVYWEPTILVRGNIAVVWAEYSFDIEDGRSHCGIDVFNLMKIDDAWKVTGIQYTVEPETCPEGR